MAYIDLHFDRFVSELQEAVGKPSIAAQNIGMDEAANHLKTLMESYGKMCIRDRSTGEMDPKTHF